MSSRSYLLIGAAGALAVIIAVAAIAAASLSGDGREKSSAPAGATTLSAEVGGAQPPATPAPPTPTPEPEPTSLPDRTSCEEIRGTDYRSEQEHQFFIASCIPTLAPVPPTSTPLPQPAGPAAQPAATTTAPPRAITPTIEGVWLLFDEIGVNFIAFDAKGYVLWYEPKERASNISGRGSLRGDAMTFDYTAVDTAFGKTVSVSYKGRRVRDEDLAELGLPATLAGVPVFFGELQRSDLPGWPIAVVAIKR